jgi:hypothetical protein
LLPALKPNGLDDMIPVFRMGVILTFIALLSGPIRVKEKEPLYR